MSVNNIIDESKQISIDLIEPAQNNPNTMSEHTFESIKQNIDEKGFIGSILVREHPTEEDKYEIIDGEHRWKACKELDYSEISCIILPYDNIESAVQLIRFNNDKGYFDNDKLKTLVQDLINNSDMETIQKSLNFTDVKFNNLIREETEEIIEETTETESPVFDFFQTQQEQAPPQNMDVCYCTASEYYNCPYKKQY